MKKPLLIGVSALALLTLSATLFAQTATGSSLITQMKAATHAFTLAGDLNPGTTGLESSPLVGKRTGDMLSAGEYNRLLELVGQGGGGISDIKIITGSAVSYTNSILSTIATATASCPANYKIIGGGCGGNNANSAILRSIATANETWSCDFVDTVNYTVSNTAQAQAICVQMGGGAGSGGSTAPATTGKICHTVFIAGTLTTVYNSHMHALQVPNTWTNESCRAYAMAWKGGANSVQYYLGCVNATGTAYGTVSEQNPRTASAGIPAQNCGW